MKAKLRFKNDPGVEGITDEEDSDFEKHSDFYDDDSGSRNESEYQLSSARQKESSKPKDGRNGFEQM